LLVDREIRAAIDAGDISIVPDAGLDARIQPASLDVRLGDTFAVFDPHVLGCVDPKEDSSHAWRRITVEPDEAFVIAPQELVLASTLEAIELCDTIAARVEGKSSLGRLGLLVHATAGYVDPGWPLAQITLEISLQLAVPIKLYPGMPIAQLSFERTAEPATAYSGKYVGQSGPAVSKYFRNWTGTRWV
jgi:dCTP deaminase